MRPLRILVGSLRAVHLACVAAKRHEARVKAEAAKKLFKLRTDCANQRTACANGDDHDSPKACCLKECEAQRIRAMLSKHKARWAYMMKVLHEAK